MDSEFSPLSGKSRGKASLYLWWALQVALILFVFLAFVLSAASLSKEHALASQITNQITNNQATRVLQSLKVASGHRVHKGFVVSYTDNPNEVSDGLGPQWDTSTFLPEGFSTAEFSSTHPLSSMASVHAFSTVGEPDQLRVRILLTNDTGSVTLGGRANLTQPDNRSIAFIHVRPLSDYVFVIMYSTWHNDTGEQTWLVTGQAEFNYQTVSLYGPQLLSSIPTDFRTVKFLSAFRNESSISSAWIQIAWGEEGHGCNFLYFALDLTEIPYLLRQVTPTGDFGFQCSYPIAGEYLNSGYFILVSRFRIALGQVNWNGLSVLSVKQEELGIHMFESVSIALVPLQNFIVLSGTQIDLEGPLAMTQVIQWTGKQSPYLTVHPPTSLLPTFWLSVYRHQISSAFIAPSEYHPQGVLLFTYVDSITGLAVLVRGKIDQFGPYIWILPSPHIRISNIPYFSFFTSNRTVGPHIFVPPNYPNRAVIVYQSEPPTVNSFYWHGGYRLAGIAEADAGPGQAVQVVRVGTSNTPFPLQPGFSYYANNTGEIHSTLSINEVYSPFGWPFRIGVAVSETLLLLDFEIIDRINNAFF